MFPSTIVPIDHQESLLFHDLILHYSEDLLLCEKNIYVLTGLSSVIPAYFLKDRNLACICY